MAPNGLIETSYAIGAINTSASGTTHHNFPSSSIWSRPLLLAPVAGGRLCLGQCLHYDNYVER